MNTFELMEVDGEYHSVHFDYTGNRVAALSANLTAAMNGVKKACPGAHTIQRCIKIGGFWVFEMLRGETC